MFRECLCNRVGWDEPAWTASIGQEPCLQPAPRSRAIEASRRGDWAKRTPGCLGRFPLTLEQRGISLPTATRLRQPTPNLAGALACEALRTGCRLRPRPGSAGPAPAAARDAPPYPKLAREPADGPLLRSRLQADAR